MSHLNTLFTLVLQAHTTIEQNGGIAKGRQKITAQHTPYDCLVQISNFLKSTQFVGGSILNCKDQITFHLCAK